jgi:ATP-dependent Lhr-like helicase
MGVSEARGRIVRALPDSAVFGAHFRMNAARALLLPRARGRKRTPFWLQRLKAKDLLAAVRGFPDFPILAETSRDCLRDVLDLPRLEQILEGIEGGSIRVVPVETAVPSPVAASLLFQFVSVYMYEWDAPKAERQLAELSLGEPWSPDSAEGRIAPLSELLRPAAIGEVLARAGHLAPKHRARSTEELAVILEELGDLTTEEMLARCDPGLEARTAGGAISDEQQASVGEGADSPLRVLEALGRIVRITVSTSRGVEVRWVASELAEEYTPLKPGTPPKDRSSQAVLQRYLRHCGPVTRAQILERYAFDEEWLDQALESMIASRELVQGYFVTPPVAASRAAQAMHVSRAPSPDRTLAQPHQYCDRHLLEQIRRRTLAMLRQEVQPVALADYAAFLIRWQGAGTAARPSEPDALRETMNKLRGVALPSLVWERDVLPARLRGYADGALGALCQSGEYVWVAEGRDPTRVHVQFVARGEGGLFLPPAPTASDESALNENARGVYAFLKEEGASFVADIQAGTGLASDIVRAALAALALAGLVTNDILEALHEVLTFRETATGERRPLSSLEEELTAMRPQRPVTRVISRERYHTAKRQVVRRLHTQAAAPWAGRWYLVHRASVLGPARPNEAMAEAQARVLLARYGVLSREAVAREDGIPDWGPLAGQLARMELRGEVRRGYFVKELSGIQYAFPEAVEGLRAAATARPDPAELVVLNAADPANIYGGEAPLGSSFDPGEWPHFHRVPSTHVVTANGRPVLIAEDNGVRMTVPGESEAGIVQHAVRVYLARPGAVRRVTVVTWNGEEALGGPAEALLRPLGFARTPSGLEWLKNS